VRTPASAAGAANFLGPLAPSATPAWRGAPSGAVPAAQGAPSGARAPAEAAGGGGGAAAGGRGEQSEDGFEAELQSVLSSLRGDGDTASNLSVEQLRKTHTPAELTHMGNDLFRGAAGCETDQPRALSLWRAAALEGDVNARYSLATALRKGEGAEADPETAMAELRALAEDGHPWAQFAVASALRDGDPHAVGGAAPAVAREEALALFKIAAKNKVAPALFNIGNMYAAGEGVEAPDLGEALLWYERAAESGDPQALFHLGQRYGNGAGVEQDAARSFEMHSAAAEAGLPLAQYAVGTHYFMGTGGVSVDYGVAAAHYEDAANAGLVVAMVNLAQMCREGLGVAQDSARAREWFGRAAPRDERARDALREMDAEDGRGQQE